MLNAHVRRAACSHPPYPHIQAAYPAASQGPGRSLVAAGGLPSLLCSGPRLWLKRRHRHHDLAVAGAAGPAHRQVRLRAAVVMGVCDPRMASPVRACRFSLCPGETEAEEEGGRGFPLLWVQEHGRLRHGSGKRPGCGSCPSVGCWGGSCGPLVRHLKFPGRMP